MITQANTSTRLFSRRAPRRLKTAVRCGLAALAPLLLLPVFSATASAKINFDIRTDIRSVDFHNFTYPTPCGEQKTLTLRHGRVPGEGCNELTKLVSLRYRDLTGDGREEAIIVIGTNCTTSCWYIEDYFVYSYVRGRLKPIFKEQQSYRYRLTEPARFSNNVWSLGRPYGLSIKRGRLFITGLAWDEGDGNCCPRYREKTSYEWRRGRFVVISRKRILDPNGPGDPLDRD
ncbi:MAG TPA: hypothetical protein VF656_07890 [Pyrinomonadaceae bacterium]